MKKLLRTMSFCIGTVFLVACQPTPEKEVVQNRKDGTLEQAIVATAAPTYAPEERYEVPEKWTEELEFRGEKIYIDANIEVAEGNAFEVLTIRQNDYSKNNILSVLETLLGENLELRDQERSYDELLEDLQHTQRGKFASYDEDTGEVLWESYDKQEEDIAELKALLAETSPDESFVSLADNLAFPAICNLIRTQTGERWYTTYDVNRIILKKNRNVNIQMESWVMQGNAYPGEKAHALEVMGITEEEAIEAARAYIAPLEKTDMRITEVEKARELATYTYSELSTGYYITMVSTPSNTIPCRYGSYDGSYFLDFSKIDETTYRTSWTQECMEIYVTADGVQSFVWNSRKKVVGTANENVQILPFEQIQERIRTLLEYGVREGSNNPIFITRIVLGGAIQQIANQGDEAFIVPTWMVFFTTELERSLNLESSLLMLSALDGSCISPMG